MTHTYKIHEKFTHDMSLLTTAYKNINFSGLQTEKIKPILHMSFTASYFSSLSVILITMYTGNTEVLTLNSSKIETW